MSGTNETFPARESGQGHNPPYIKGGVSRSRGAEIPGRQDPTACPGVTRILLSERASLALTESEEKVFALVARDVWPGDRNRWVILLKPCPLALARAAEGLPLEPT
jgi:hypothetical protein